MGRITLCILFIITVMPVFVPAQQKQELPINERTEFESEVISEINSARENTLRYSRYIDNYLSLMRGKVLYLPKRAPFLMFEGKPVILEAIKELDRARDVNPLKRSEVLVKVARAQLQDLLENPELGHVGKDGANLKTRIGRFGTFKGPVAENISYLDETARQVVLTMLIDDGVESRQHRKNILNKAFSSIGVACGIATGNKSICVVAFGDQIEEKSDKPVAIEL